jgi:hypothetical protein
LARATLRAASNRTARTALWTTGKRSVQVMVPRLRACNGGSTTAGAGAS